MVPELANFQHNLRGIDLARPGGDYTAISIDVRNCGKTQVIRDLVEHYLAAGYKVYIRTMRGFEECQPRVQTAVQGTRADRRANRGAGKPPASPFAQLGHSIRSVQAGRRQQTKR